VARRKSTKRQPALRVFFDEDDIHVDNFAGGGGASEAYEEAMRILTGVRRAPHIAVNHDADALAMHAANHPSTIHLCEDVFRVKPREVCKGRRVRSAWFSPDCTHFSGAKGGEPCDQKIRGLAWSAIMWAAAVLPDVIFLENVREFEGWGPLHRTHSNGCAGEHFKACPKKHKGCHFSRPIASRKGETFRAFVRKLRSLGYVVEWKLLRACDFGAPTTRLRFFLVARRDGKPIRWPTPTHGKSGELLGLKPYRTAAECIDWSIPCPSIFDRDKPLKPKTLARIARGIRKYVLDAARPFVVPVNHGGAGRRDHRVHDVDEPLPTITGGQRGGHAVVTPYLMPNNTNNVPTPADAPVPTVTTGNRNFVVAPTLVRAAHGDVDASGKRRGKGGHSIEEPLPTVCAGGGDHAIAAAYLVHRSNGERQGQEPRVYDAESPLGTIVAQGQKHALCTAFLEKAFSEREGGWNGGAPADAPISTVTARDHHRAVVAQLVRYNGDRRDGEARGAEVGEPLPTQDTSNRFGLVASHLIKLQGTSEAHVSSCASSMDDPLPTITAQGWKVAQVAAFLVKYYGAAEGQHQSAGEPLDTVTAKPRFGLVTVTIDGEEYVIVDIGMRMLEPRELFRAQGFPETYEIAPVVEKKTKRGKVVKQRLSKTAQIRMCGNSVSPPPAIALMTCNLAEAA
jgi:DNA (cytosine-5)-methyltransferase 1